MPDTVRPDAEILAALADNDTGAITAQTMRDMFVTVMARIDSADQPDPFAFADVTDAALQTTYTHAPIVLTGLKQAAIARASGLTFSVNDGAFVTEAMVQAGDVVTARLNSSAENAAVVQGTLTVGAVTDTWSITTGNFWTPTGAWPELIAFGFFQEDLQEGPVATWSSGGLRPKNATGAATKLPAGKGVLFTGTQNLQWPVDTDSVVLHRWWVAIARTDAPGSAAIPILTVHSASGGNAYRQPALRFELGQLWSWLRDEAADRRLGTPVSTTSFDAWHIVVGFHRGWEHRAWIDGVELGPNTFTTWLPPNHNLPSWLGAGAGAPGNPALPKSLAIDCVLVGHGSPSDAFIDKLVGWAHWRVGRADLLPADHPYKAMPPIPDSSEGAPDLYEHDQAAWSAWTAIPQAERVVHRGEPAPAADGYAVVFRDDFFTHTIASDLAGSPSDLWFAPGFNTAVGGNAALLLPNAMPNCYIHDPAGGGTMTLRLQERTSGNNQWVSGAFLSVNRCGKGRQWGKGRFRMRCRFPHMAAPRPGFFPAFWAYDADFLVYRTRNRLETDFFEYDGLNGLFINAAMHVHTAKLNAGSPEVAPAELSHKIIGTSLSVANGFDPQIDIYDGQFHTWEFCIEDELSHVICDDQEVARMPTTPWLLRPKHLIVDWAYRSSERAATPGQTYDMMIDWIEVLQRESDLAVVPQWFSARPTLSGTRGEGKTIMLTPNTAPGQHEHRWYADGVPLVGATGVELVETAASVGKQLRCHVRNLSLWPQCEAWTEALSATPSTLSGAFSRAFSVAFDRGQ